MKRLFSLSAAAAALTLIGCGGDGMVDPETQFALDVHVVNEDGAAGAVQVVAMSNTIDDRCTADCVYGVDGDHDAELRPIEGDGTVFVGWSGDCEGTGNVTKTAAAGGSVDCTATFTTESDAGPPREGILVANRRTCQPNASPPAGFNCGVAAGSSFNINAPSATLGPALLTANPSCYYYRDVSDFSSEDHGEVDLVTSQIDAVGTWSNGYYNLSGVGPVPFLDIDSLTITTQGGKVQIDSAPAITLVDDATDGLHLHTGGTADSTRLMAFGYDADDISWGVICRMPFDADAPISDADFLDAIALASNGSFPDTVFAGFSNQEDVTGWDDITVVGEAVNWFQLDGATLVSMGELQQP